MAFRKWVYVVLSKKERILVDRLRKSGRTINEDRMHAHFRLTIRPLTTIGTECGHPVSGFDDEAFSSVRELEFNSPSRGIMITPIIVDETLAKVPADSSRYRSKDRTV
jgi:hypothetical protein